MRKKILGFLDIFLYQGTIVFLLGILGCAFRALLGVVLHRIIMLPLNLPEFSYLEILFIVNLAYFILKPFRFMENTIAWEEKE